MLHIIIWRWNLPIPEVTEILRIGKELHVKLFYKSAPVPLPTWFRNGLRCKMDRKSMLENFPNNIKSQSLTCFKIFLELHE